MNRFGTSTYEITGKALALTTLLAYLSTLFVLPFHQLSHQVEQEEICYEDNACHLKLVHNDNENGCDHESHVTDEKIHCELCALRQLNNPTDYYHWTYKSPVLEYFKEGVFDKAIAPNSYEPGILVRGPPINS